MWVGLGRGGQRQKRTSGRHSLGFAAGQRQAGVWLGAGENKYRGQFGSRYMLCLDKNAIKKP